MTDEPEAVTAGRAALAHSLVRYRFYDFCMQCPTPSCAYRRAAVDMVLARAPEETVGVALARLRCATCREPPEIVGLHLRDPARSDWLLLRNEAPKHRWR